MGQTYPVPNPPAAFVPIYVPTISYVGGVKGDDTDTATANATNDYAPRTQKAKATLMGTTLAVDVARPRGWIEPRQPYGAVPAAPVVSSISPTTGTAASLPMTVTITGTGFTPWSTVRTGGSAVNDPSGTYLSPTTMKVALMAAVPGTVSVAVEDHDVLSNVDKLFTVT
jgi:IPT/TIG domain